MKTTYRVSFQGQADGKVIAITEFEALDGVTALKLAEELLKERQRDGEHLKCQITPHPRVEPSNEPAAAERSMASRPCEGGGTSRIELTEAVQDNSGVAGM